MIYLLKTSKQKNGGGGFFCSFNLSTREVYSSRICLSLLETLFLKSGRVDGGCCWCVVVVGVVVRRQDKKGRRKEMSMIALKVSFSFGWFVGWLTVV